MTGRRTAARDRLLRVASAPGKVLVSGEYAVLDGAPAIVMAVDRRARVRVSAAGGNRHRLFLPGMGEDELAFRIDDAGAVSLEDDVSAPPIDLSLVGQVWSTLGMRPRPALRLELDTRPFYDESGRRKLGLGSSAALAVALTAALLPGTPGAADVERLAQAAHRHWQAGRGSGADIAAAVHGGVLAYRAAAGTDIESLRWPDGLHWALLWSGLPAGTADRVARFRRQADGRPAREAAQRLARAAEGVLAAWRRNDARPILEGLSDYLRALQAFDVDAGVGIFEAGHGALVEAAAGGSVVYKPCGAGGGDVGMAFALDRGALDDFVVSAGARGFGGLDVAVDPRGAEGL